MGMKLPIGLHDKTPGAEWNRVTNAATTRLSTGRRAWTSVEDLRLITMRDDGRSHTEIAIELKRTWNSVQQRHTLLKRQGRI